MPIRSSKTPPSAKAPSATRDHLSKRYDQYAGRDHRAAFASSRDIHAMKEAF